MTPWPSVPLGEVVTFQRGYDLPHNARKQGAVPIVSSAGITDYHNVPMVNPPGVVTGRYGTIGEIFLITEPFWPLNTTLYVRDFHGNDPSFVYYLLHRFDFHSFSGKSGVPGVNRNDLHLEPVVLPKDVGEQRAIAAALSDVDALLGGLERLIAKKRDLKQAAMQQLLTGQTRLPGFRGKWEVNSLRRFVRNFIVPMRDKPKRLNGDIPWCRIEDFDGMYLTDSKSNQRVDIETVRAMNLKVYPTGALLVSCSADLGRCAIVARPLVSNQTFIGLEMDDQLASNVFFYYLMTSKAGELNNSSSGTTISYLSREQFEEFAVFVPLDKKEQTAIAAVLSDMDAELAALEARRDKTRALKQGMMQELLTGRTRLVEPGIKADKKDAARTDGRQANIHFKRSVLAAEIVDRLHEEPTFGHVKFEKTIFLVERLCKVDTGSTYHRDAAGPYDNRAMRSIDSQLRAQQWFDAQKNEGRYRYVPMRNRGGYRKYFERYFAGIRAPFERIIDVFKTFDTERCEIVATLFAAWDDLVRQHKPVSDEAILHEVLNQWHESKRRIPEHRWCKTLSWMRDNGFVPEEAGDA